MTRREKTAVRRQQIIEAAFQLLAELPLADVTTRRIAAVVGISQPALFRHFTSRDAVLLGVLDDAQRELGGLVEAALGGPTAQARLLGLGRALASFIERRPGLPRLLLADLGPSPAGTAVRAALQKLVAIQRALVGEIVKDGIADASLRADLDP
ncbi:MAG: TetR/AcrR family transcriptional regulator, partial [Deltaproteobacteria bacterium]